MQMTGQAKAAELCPRMGEALGRKISATSASSFAAHGRRHCAKVAANRNQNFVVQVTSISAVSQNLSGSRPSVEWMTGKTHGSKSLRGRWAQNGTSETKRPNIAASGARLKRSKAEEAWGEGSPPLMVKGIIPLVFDVLELVTSAIRETARSAKTHQGLDTTETTELK